VYFGVLGKATICYGGANRNVHAKACRERARACRSVPRLCTLATFSVRSVHKINTPVKSISTRLLLYISI